jgi:Protein of unknown function (DUF2852)
MPIVAKLDELGRGAWIALMVLGFVFWWPVGLAILAFSLWSGRMGCWNHQAMTHWHERMGRSHWGGHWGGPWAYHPRSTGNRAFDEYRTETLRRLEEEQREFREFLDRLRMAKDKSEFDQFMADRRNRPQQSPPSQG